MLMKISELKVVTELEIKVLLRFFNAARPHVQVKQGTTGHLIAHHAGLVVEGAGPLNILFAVVR